ncbi:hypothetical protein C0989_003484 [Termitomyces sp. Mn162]|nr:hypothetical protein C0989_003484 [Termitomyces sp. Mn162]
MTLVNRSPSIVIPSSLPLAHGSPAISCVTLHERCEPTSPTSPNNLSSPTIPLPPHPRKSSAPTSHPYLLSPHDTPYRPSTPQTETDRTSDLQDHSRLKAAWDAMLASRFIAESTLSVLPFYLSSTFPDVQSIAPVKVLLPPNSKTKQSRSSSEPPLKSAKPQSPPSLVRTSSESTCSSGWDTSTLTPLSRTSSSDSINSYTTEFAQMHLASTVHTVAGCKEAIWQEYKKLYDVNVAKIVTPDADALSGHTASSGPGNDKSSIRESFDDEWAAWYNDMTDRIGMRTLMAQLNWAEPPGQRPDWHLWRAKVQQSNENKGSSDSLEYARNPPALCRSMRGFIGCKPRLA